jgi:hypothetical protein
MEELVELAALVVAERVPIDKTALAVERQRTASPLFGARRIAALDPSWILPVALTVIGFGGKPLY